MGNAGLGQTQGGIEGADGAPDLPLIHGGLPEVHVLDDDPAPGRVGLVAGPGAAVLLDDVEVEALADLDNSG